MTNPNRFRNFTLLLAGGLLAAGCGPSPDQGSAPGATASVAPTTRAGAPLADSAFRLEWGPLTAPDTMAAGKTVPVRVVVTNRSAHAWPDPVSSDPAGNGAFAVRVGYRWIGATKAADSVAWDTNRADFVRPVGPGEQASVVLDVKAPTTPGRYTLQIDLLQEMVAWFGTRGAPKLTRGVEVR